MKNTGLKNAYAMVMQKITMKMLNMPAWAYCVQMRTTVREVSMLAASAESSLMFFLVSTCDSSKMDWPLSVAGPYESTAIVTGPMPSRPNATRPNANTDGYCMNRCRSCCENVYARNSRTASVSAFQNTEKLPATI